ncbi:tRNA (adenosine(37)-N6)-dimethylallyltransferase MiaA [Miniphocaeibacter massiliensis]|uniref:tRNA (adenosine(37)-N6)-dimethylallyltransferase MiaA n=1 Tax=Miniphocaeibacter massiliensis TaxID=2041841 RepID=UPI000C07C115|nr:tRNA (adenosine(37)-N6)-dimethylallyltransferase MiaA [Miniphocaeibacter massiliensis]
MMKEIILIVGPTGSGKTSLSLNLYGKLDSEIISADSMQIYKYMDIGTAKVSEKIREKIKHHMIDIVNPDDAFSVASFQKDTFKIIDNLIIKNKIPIVVGGTGLYINSLTYNLDFSNAKSDESIRNKLYYEYEENGKQFILNKLKKVDLDSYNTIEHNNIKRVIRAIEIYEITGVPYSKQNKDFRNENNNYNFKIYGLTDDRKLLYERINNRVDEMIKDGLFDEVKFLIDNYDNNSQSFKGIGYKEIIDYYNGIYSKNEAIEKLKQNSRKYAKRQLTWFRRDKRIKWFNLSEYKNNIAEISNKIYKEIKNGQI